METDSIKQYQIFTTNKLKVIASIAMLFDHFVSVFFPHNALISLVFRLFGRTAAPIFCFFIAEGYHYTSNVKKYIGRLLILAVISHFPYNLAFGYGLSILDATSIIWPLALGLIALAVFKNKDLHIIIRLLVIALCCALSYTANWFFVAVLWILVFGIFHEKRNLQLIGFFNVCLIYLFWQLRRYGLFDEVYPQWFQYGIFLAIPLILMFNGKQGKKTKFMTWFFYIFYPFHLLCLFLLKRFSSFSGIFGG